MAREKPEDASSKVCELFEEGKELTQDLLKENERLRYKIAGLKNEARRSEKQSEITGVYRLKERIRQLESEVTSLSKEISEQRQLSSMIENENKDFADRYIKVERQNSDLVNLYVASYRLHSTLNYSDVVTIIKEIVINLIGAEVFGVYIVNKDASKLELIADEGLEDQRDAGISLGEGILGKTAINGDTYVESLAEKAPSSSVHDDRLLACFPLKVKDEVMGVIAIYRLLVQKLDFQPVDFEMFNLLSGHAATALYGAKMFTLSERKRSTLEGFIDLLKEN